MSKIVYLTCSDDGVRMIPTCSYDLMKWVKEESGKKNLEDIWRTKKQLRGHGPEPLVFSGGAEGN